MNLKVLLKQFISIYKEQGALSLLRYIAIACDDKIIKRFIKGSFSQKGEDLIIDKILGFKRHGVYVDVGAHNPNMFNNTKRFYLKGWHGINIEPNPTLIKNFRSLRKRDINLNIGIKNTSEIAKFYDFETDLLSTFSKHEKENNIQLGYKLRREVDIPVKTLKSVLALYCKTKIDFISIDTEGLDYEVLKSNNWEKFRPTLVCVETGDFNSMINGQKISGKKKLIDSLMKKNGYRQVYTNGLNSIYQNS